MEHTNLGHTASEGSPSSEDSDIFQFEQELPLHAACRQGHTDIVRVLLNEPDLDIELKSHQDGKTALHIACENNFHNIVQILLEHNAVTATSEDQDGNTPLHFACKAGAISIVDLLLKYEVDSSLQNKAKQTPLHMLLPSGDEIEQYKIAQHEITHQLLNHGANVNAKDSNGNTLLHIACEKGYDDLVGQLLKGGANASIRNMKHHTPYEIAKSNKYTAIVELLYQEDKDCLPSFKIR